MTDCYDPTAWIRERIAAKKALLIAYETAMTALAGGAQSYQLNTGQTQQLVTKANLGSMRLVVQGLESDIATLEARLGCTGAQIYVRPGW